MSIDDAEWSAAARVLGVRVDAGAAEVRARYLERLLVVHPDHNRSPDATERTVELTTAYRMLLTRPEGTRGSPAQAAATDPAADGIDVDQRIVELIDLSSGAGDVEIRVLDEDTIAVRAPAGETVLRMIEAGGELGEITFCDPSLGMVQVVIEFLDAPTAQILMTTQGRGDGTTEVFCSVDPFNGGAVPATRPVVEIIAAALAQT